MEEKMLNEKESLELISQMILNTRKKMEEGNGMPFLIWGYATFIVSLVVYYFLSTAGDYHYNLIWFAIPVLGCGGMYFSKRKEKKHSKTYIDRIIVNIWTVIGIAGLLVSCAAFFVSIPVLPIEMLLMGIGTALTGLVIRFKPVIISGFVGMISCALPFIIKGYGQIIVFGIVFLIMMVIPGHILNYKGRKKHV